MDDLKEDLFLFLYNGYTNTFRHKSAKVVVDRFNNESSIYYKSGNLWVYRGTISKKKIVGIKDIFLGRLNLRDIYYRNVVNEFIKQI